MKLRLLFCGLLISSAVSAQLKCGTPDEDFSAETQRRQRFAQLSMVKRQVANTPVGIPLKMHLLTNNDGSTAYSTEQLNDALAELNRVYQPAGLVFYFAGTTFNSYANTGMNQGTATDAQQQAFHTANGVNNAINVYVASEVRVGGEPVGGWSYLTPQTQFYNRMFLTKSQLNDDKTTPHEFGHYFNLHHTFNNSTHAAISNRELVTRNTNEIAPRLSANCEDTGDYLCDTHADPYPINDASQLCGTYDGTDVDANGDLFTPPMNNYMDYRFCWPFEFTAGQMDRIATGKSLVLSAPGFTLNAAPTTQPVATNVTATIDGYHIKITWTDNSSVETGYIIERATAANGTFTPIGGVSRNVTTFYDTNTNTGTSYFYRVKASNTWNSYSQTSAAVTGPLCGNTWGQTCNVNVDPTQANWNIQDFSLFTNSGTLISNTNSGCSPGGIGNFYDELEGLIQPGQILQFLAKTRMSSDQLAYSIRAKVWVDWNQDGIFSTEERMYSSVSPSHYQVFGFFTVPNTIQPGSYRLRVAISVLNELESCYVDYGEIEDYKLTYVPLSTSDQTTDRFQIYPNPVKETLHIATNQNLKKVEVYDLSGKLILAKAQDVDAIGVKNLPSGLYLIKIQTDQGVHHSKFIKE